MRERRDGGHGTQRILREQRTQRDRAKARAGLGEEFAAGHRPVNLVAAVFFHHTQSIYTNSFAFSSTWQKSATALTRVIAVAFAPVGLGWMSLAFLEASL